MMFNNKIKLYIRNIEQCERIKNARWRHFDLWARDYATTPANSKQGIYIKDIHIHRHHFLTGTESSTYVGVWIKS